MTSINKRNMYYYLSWDHLYEFVQFNNTVAFVTKLYSLSLDLHARHIQAFSHNSKPQGHKPHLHYRIHLMIMNTQNNHGNVTS